MIARLLAYFDEITACEGRAIAARLRRVASILEDGSFKAFVERIADGIEGTL